MAERLPSLPPLPPPPPPHEPAAASGSPLDTIVPPPRAPHETYIIQVPKDQIYHVPPPENAHLFERYRNQGERARGEGKRRSAGRGCGCLSSPCASCLARTLGAALAVAILLGIGIVLVLAVRRPEVPWFAVDNLTVHNTSHAADYDFFLTATNPNKVTGLWYKDGGKATLLCQGVIVAKGEVRKPEDGGEDQAEFSVLLHGVSGGGTPGAVKKALKGSKEAVTLLLSVELAVQVRIGEAGFGGKRLAVDCDIKAAGLRKDVHIASQKCKSSFGV